MVVEAICVCRTTPGKVDCRPSVARGTSNIYAWMEFEALRSVGKQDFFKGRCGAIGSSATLSPKIGAESESTPRIGFRGFRHGI